MIKYFKYFIQAFLIYLFFSIGKIMGLKLSQKIFSSLFQILGPLVKSNKVSLKNLNIFSPSMSLEKKRKILKSMWSNYGMTFIEYIYLNLYRQKNSFIEFQNYEVIKKIKENKRPVIFISGHFANFEMMSMEITKNNIQLATIYRPLNNIFLNPLMEYLRKKYICSNQIKKGRGGVKEAIQFIKEGYSVAMMIDQRVSEGEKINLFNYPALTTTLPARLALKFNLSIVPVFIKREKNNLFKIKFYEPIETINKDKKELTLSLNLILEKMIRNNPEQWIWTHDRWK